MKLAIYQIDAFTDNLFGGNPAAVIPLKEWIDDKLMQQIALENNLSETVFFVPVSRKKNKDKIDFDIRWFTPAVEINLCGHATLASGYVLYNILDFKKKEIRFNCKSGVLKVKKKRNQIWLDFPSWKPEPFTEYLQELKQALGNVPIIGLYKSRDLLVELADVEAVKNCQPDFNLLKKINDKVIITAKGNEYDFVSRFFAPSAGVNEDPATGSAHSQLIPFWSEKLNKQKLSAFQLSPRGAVFSCEQKDERVMIGGNCIFYMKGKITLPAKGKSK